MELEGMQDLSERVAAMRETVQCEAHDGVHLDANDCLYPHYTDPASRERFLAATRERFLAEVQAEREEGQALALEAAARAVTLESFRWDVALGLISMAAIVASVVFALVKAA